MGDQANFGTNVKEREDTKTKEPSMYKVLFHNDNYTTMEFVVYVLMHIFQKPVAEANRIMLDVHKKGRGTVGVYTYDVAVTRVTKTRKLAKEYEYPLKCTIEEV